jgi:acyl carrier protein
MQLQDVSCARDWLLERLVQITGMPGSQLSADVALADLGLSSSEAAELTGDLERWLGTRLSPDLLYHCRTPREVVERALQRGEYSAPGEAQRAAIRAGTDDEPIAIVGMACRFPGARDPAELWSLLSGGHDAICEVPASRWDIDAVYDPTPGTPGRMSTRHGGFIAAIEQFDASAFGISPREAQRMDPQQRLLLEVAWESLEDAGLNRDVLRGSRTGVFVGVSNLEYRDRQFQDRLNIDPYAGTGNASSIVANRLSYYFDLRGPSIAIDTACSSSRFTSRAIVCAAGSPAQPWWAR